MIFWQNRLAAPSSAVFREETLLTSSRLIIVDKLEFSLQSKPVSQDTKYYAALVSTSR